jgi:RHS repeat-associated protein
MRSISKYADRLSPTMPESPHNNYMVDCFYYCWVSPSNSNGKEKDYESGFHYYGARYYWSEVLTGWLSVDPMADKYPSISPYAYCAWNPVKLVDPNGDTIRPAPNSSPQFVAQLNMAIQYLVDNGADDVYSRLQSNPTTIYVSKVDFESAELTSSKPLTKYIEWCPTAGLYTTEEIMMSPTTVLEHEFDHMLQTLEHPAEQAADYKNKVDLYGNMEEVRVIDGSEQTTACRLGEIKDGQFTRKNHAGNFYEVLSPTSTMLKNPAQTLIKPSVMPHNLPEITIKPEP